MRMQLKRKLHIYRMSANMSISNITLCAMASIIQRFLHLSLFLHQCRIINCLSLREVMLKYLVTLQHP